MIDGRIILIQTNFIGDCSRRTRLFIFFFITNRLINKRKEQFKCHAKLLSSFTKMRFVSANKKKERETLSLSARKFWVLFCFVLHEDTYFDRVSVWNSTAIPCDSFYALQRNLSIIEHRSRAVHNYLYDKEKFHISV